MSWSPSDAWNELAESDLPSVLRTRCHVLLLRMRIERLAEALPGTALVPTAGHGRPMLRLWGLMALAAERDRPATRDQVRQVQRVYNLSSDYLHSRRAAVVPSPTELATWLAGVEALEALVASSAPSE
jgi:hypothetical protein